MIEIVAPERLSQSVAIDLLILSEYWIYDEAMLSRIATPPSGLRGVVLTADCMRRDTDGSFLHDEGPLPRLTGVTIAEHALTTDPIPVLGGGHLVDRFDQFEPLPTGARVKLQKRNSLQEHEYQP